MTTGLIWKLLTRTIALVVVALLALEAFGLLTGPVRYHAAPVQLDGSLGFRGIPGFTANLKDAAGTYEVRLNDQGFRGRALEDASGDPGRRVVFYGDAQLTGLSVREEDLVTSRLERRLQADAGRPAGTEEPDSDASGGWKTFNLGIPDTGTGQQLLAHLTTLEQTTPDVVVLALHPPDDLIDDSLELVRESPRLPGDGLRPFVEIAADGQPESHFANPLRSKLRAGSAGFALLERELGRLAARRGMRTLAHFPPVPGPKARMERRAFPLVWMEMFRAGQDSAVWEAAWEHSFTLIRAFRETAEAQGARFLVVVIPGEHQVQRTARTAALEYQIRRGLGLKLDRLVDWNAPERRLRAFFEGEGIEYASLLEPLRAATREGIRPFDTSGRLSAAGHEVWAEAVYERLSTPALAVTAPVGSDPVDLIPTAEDFPEPLELAEAEASGLLGSGWKTEGFVAEGDEEAETRRGRWMQKQGMMMVPNRRGTLVVKGFVPAHPRAANELSINLGNVVLNRHPIQPGGPFEIRFDAPPAREAITIDGYIPLYLGAHRKSGGASAPILVEQVSISDEAVEPTEADDTTDAADAADASES